jgi:hypothetical protein
MRSTESQKSKKVFLVAGLLYLASYGLMLAYSTTYFWDDWFNYFGMTSSEVRNSTGPFSGFSPVRLVAEGWMAEFFPSSFRILSFIWFPIAAFCLFKTLLGSRFLVRAEVSTIALLFLILPVNSARASMTIFMYSSSYCAFFVGWWLFSLKRRWWTLLLSLGFFLMSFDTASFLVFVAIPLLHSYFEHREAGGPFITWIKRNFVFVLSPIAYWFIEPIINPTLDSVRAAYYTPSLSGILRGLVVGMLVTLIAGYFVLIRGWRYGTHRGGVQVLVGLLITWLGMFPYMALGHFPNLNALLIGFVPGASDWDSRHQLLMPLGLGLVIVGVFNFLNPARLWAGVLVVCGLSTVLNLTFSQEYYLDSIKTQRIIEAFRSNPDVKDFDMALIDDQALRFNARGRAIRSYEWDYMLKAANPGLEQTTDVFRYVDCNVMDPDAIIVIQASNGKLETLLTRNPGITVSVQKISVCNK